MIYMNEQNIHDSPALEKNIHYSPDQENISMIQGYHFSKYFSAMQWKLVSNS